MNKEIEIIINKIENYNYLINEDDIKNLIKEIKESDNIIKILFNIIKEQKEIIEKYNTSFIENYDFNEKA
jgi:hypothetical protein